MANRTITLNLQARVDGMLSGLRRAQSETSRTASKWSAMQAAIRKNSGAINDASGTLIKSGVAMAAPALLATKAYAKFDKQMSSVSAATHASAADMKALRAEAIKVGSDTKFSATEAGQGIEELAKAGISTKNILGGGLKGSMDLAAAGNLSVGESAEIAASAMTQFKLKGTQVPHVADLLAAGAGKAQGSVHDLGEALNQGGLVASQTGLSIEETTGSLAAFASAGLTGSDAGTSFKTMLQRLTPQSEKAANLMKELGISAYDSQGKFVGMANYAGQLKSKLSGMSQEQRNATMSVLFGSDAVRAASVMYEQGASGIQSWIDKVNDSGYAAETASRMQDNLSGDIEKLGGSFESLALKSGGGVNDGLRALVQGAEGVVDAIGKIPAPITSTLTVLSGLGGVAAIAVGGFGKLSTSFIQARDNMRRFSSAFPKTAGVLGDLGKAAGVTAAALVGLQVVKGLYNHFNKLQTSAQDATAALLQVKQAKDGLDAGKSIDDLFDQGTFMGIDSAIDGIGDSVKKLNPAWWDLTGHLGNFGADVLNINNGNKQAANTFDQLDTAMAKMGTTAAGQKDVAKTFAAMSDQVKKSGGDVEDLKPRFEKTFAAFRAQAQALDVDLPEKKIWNWIMTGNVPTELQKAAKEAKSTGKNVNEAKGILDSVTVPPALSEIISKLTEAGSAALGASNSTIAYKEKLAGLSKEAAKYKDLAKGGSEFNFDTEKGRAAQTVLNNFAASALQASSDMDKAGASAGKQVAHLSESREAFIKNAVAMGLNSKAAAKMADDYGLIPSKVFTTAEFKEGDTRKRVGDIVSALNTMPKGKKITVEDNSKGTIKALEALGFKVKKIPGTKKIEVTATGVKKTSGEIDKAAGKKRDAKIGTHSDGKGGKQADSEAKKKRDAKIGTHSDGKGGKQADAEANKRRTATLRGVAETGGAEASLNHAARDRMARISVAVTTTITKVQRTVNAAVAAAGGNARTAAQMKRHGGKLRGHADGYRLPLTGPGTDKVDGFTAVNGDGAAIARVDAGEWVVNRRSSSAFDQTLAHINRGDRRGAMASLLAGYRTGGVVGELPGLASGGRYRWAGRQVTYATRAVSRASANLSRQKAQLRAAEKAEAAAQKRLDHAKSKAAKARARAALSRAKARVRAETRDVTAADKKREQRRDKLQKARERRTRLGELEFTTRRQLSRGDFKGMYGAGNFQGVDALFEQSKNADLSRYRRKQLSSLAYKQEAKIKSLTKQSDRLAASLEKATAKRDELLQVKDSVADSVRGGWSLSDTFSKLKEGEVKGPLSAGRFTKSATRSANRMMKFSRLLGDLRKMGYNEAVVQEVASMGSQEGFQVGTALAKASKGQRRTLNKQYDRMDFWSGKAGDQVTASMYKGGVNAASGVVKGIESQQKAIEKAFTRMAKQGERAFKRALGIHSPSKVMEGHGVNTVAGQLRGVKARTPDAVQAMFDLGKKQSDAYSAAVSTPSYVVPASAEVARYSAQQGGSAYTADAVAAAVSSAIAGYQPVVNIDGRAFYGIMRSTEHRYGTRR